MGDPHKRGRRTVVVGGRLRPDQWSTTVGQSAVAQLVTSGRQEADHGPQRVATSGWPLVEGRCL
jgi:hypothetical protein